MLDPILASLSKGSDGFRVGVAEIAVMAYPDDNALLSSFMESFYQMRRQLASVVEYLGSIGKNLSVGKCEGFVVERRGDA